MWVTTGPIEVSAVWLAMLSLLSIRTPRLDTVVENWTWADSTDSSVVESLLSFVVYRARLAASYRRSSLADCWTSKHQHTQHIQRTPWWSMRKMLLVHWCIPACRLLMNDQQVQNSPDDTEQLSGVQHELAAWQTINDRRNILAVCDCTGTIWSTSALCLWCQTTAPDDVTRCHAVKGRTEVKQRDILTICGGENVRTRKSDASVEWWQQYADCRPSSNSCAWIWRASCCS